MSKWSLRLGDCFDTIDGLDSLPGKSIDVVITDPPFEAEAHTLQRRVKRGSGGDDLGRKVVMSVEPLPFPPITEAQRIETARQIARVTRRWALIFCQVEASHLWSAACEEFGFTYRRTCIWVKPDGMPQYSGDRPGMGYETIVACHAPCASTWNGGGKHGVFVFNKSDADRTGHPTQKPESLMGELVSLFTNPGELVLDPFAGSGTTGVACIRLGRRFIGWEKDPGYHQKATTRLMGTKEQLVLPMARTKAKQGSLL